MGVARRDGPVRPVRRHAAHGRAPVLGALARRGAVGARSPPAVRAVESSGGPQNTSRRPTRPIGRPTGFADVEECPLRTMVQQPRVAPGTLEPPPGNGPASAWPCSPPRPCSWPWPSTSGGGGAARPAPPWPWCWWPSCSGRAPTRPSWERPTWGHLALGRRQVRRPGAAPAGLVRVRGPVRRARVVGQRAEPGPAGHPPGGGPGPAGQRRHPRPHPLLPAEAAFDPDAVAEPGPLFWPHLGLLRRGDVGQPDPDGGGPAAGLQGLPAGHHHPDRQPGRAVRVQPALQPGRRARSGGST
jgi:hypothetical protein